MRDIKKNYHYQKKNEKKDGNDKFWGEKILKKKKMLKKFIIFQNSLKKEFPFPSLKYLEPLGFW